MIARREIFLCDTWSGPKSTRFATNAPLWTRSAALLAELGRRSCGADVAGWLNATVPLGKAIPYGIYDISANTGTGLSVHCVLDTEDYPTGIKYERADVEALPLTRHEFHGEWNYTLHPNDTP